METYKRVWRAAALPRWDPTVFFSYSNAIIRLARWDGTVSRNAHTVLPPSPFQIRTAYQTYMKKIAKLLGGGFNSDAKMMEIYNFEKKLAQVRRRQTEPGCFIKAPWADFQGYSRFQVPHSTPHRWNPDLWPPRHYGHTSAYSSRPIGPTPIHLRIWNPG